MEKIVEHSDREISLMKQFIEGCRKCNLDYPLECGDCIEEILNKLKEI